MWGGGTGDLIHCHLVFLCTSDVGHDSEKVTTHSPNHAGQKCWQRQQQHLTARFIPETGPTCLFLRRMVFKGTGKGACLFLGEHKNCSCSFGFPLNPPQNGRPPQKCQKGTPISSSVFGKLVRFVTKNNLEAWCGGLELRVSGYGMGVGGGGGVGSYPWSKETRLSFVCTWQAQPSGSLGFRCF